MEIDFTRVDLMQCSALNRKTLRLLPMGKKKQQKVVLGDETGVLTCFTVKKGDIVNRFKTLPWKEISRVELGGPTKNKKDKIFASAGQVIIGLTKKGKEFFRFETTLTEVIKSMYVEGLSIWTGGEYMYNQFIDGKDKQFYMSSDRINDLFCMNITSDSDYDTVLACQDRVVRVIQGSEILYEVAVDGPATTVEQHKVAKFSPSKEIVYGTSNGAVGQLLATNTSLEKGWTVDPGKHAGGVNCISFCDVTKKGSKDIIVGRDDGTIEVLGFEDGPKPKVMWKTNINESIQSLEIGHVTSAATDELIVGSYSGKVISFASINVSNKGGAGSEDVAQKSQSNNNNTAAAQEDVAKKIKVARQDLTQLMDKARKEKEKYQKVSTAMIAVVPQFKVQSKFGLEPDGNYVLTIEVKMHIESLILQSDVPLDIEEYDKSQCIISKTRPNPDEGDFLLATCRVTDPTNRVEIKIRTIEGQYGILNVYVLPTTTPKQSQLVSFPIKPLSWHQRANNIKDAEKRLVNEVKLTGTFTMSEVHSWISLCLPEVPEKITQEEITLDFESVFVGTLLQCCYKKGDAVFRSDSLSTLSILREFITREATARKSKFNVSIGIKEESVHSVLDMIHPKLEYQFALSSKIKLIDALNELKLQEPDVSFLTGEYAEILVNSEKIKREFQLQPRALEQLFGVIVDLYASKYKFKGKKVSGKEVDLRRQLASYNIVNLKAFFNTVV